ncbi:LysR family transcriptional regulator [Xanthomonas sp. SI]|uniref:LysR family transcriptional regulator n=1 Tax=Xanthomonas sp. SI TaxID=2724123 RepID=UPI0021079FFA|nr:LysR family transcriptional regulator [Xanthomonas sp. SI]
MTTLTSSNTTTKPSAAASSVPRAEGEGEDMECVRNAMTPHARRRPCPRKFPKIASQPGENAQMFDWENFRHFLAVARAGTLSGAARALHVDHATVSRRLTALETELQAVLVERLPRCCRLTPMGVHLYEHAKTMETAAFAAERLVRADHTPLSGTVTLSAPPVLVTHLLAQRLPDFRNDYPGIRLSVLAQAQQVSLSRREADVALRLVRSTEASSVVRKLAQMPFALYASRDYAAAHRPEDWTFIAYDAQFADMPQQQWLLDIAGKRTVGCELSDIGSHLAAARAGAGVAGLPCFLGDADPAMLRLEHTGSVFSRDIWLVVHRDLRRAAPVRAVLDFVAAAVAATPGLGLEPPVAKRSK